MAETPQACAPYCSGSSIYGVPTMHHAGNPPSSPHHKSATTRDTGVPHKA